MSDTDGVSVSIIVPARNEEACLALCLESLVAQKGIAFEAIVVDDASTDRTAEIARSFAGVRELSAPPLREGWTGKNNAMAAGAKIARGKWLLFTDADTVHKPGSLARAVAEAEEHGAALLSYSPEQEVRSFWEKALMPVIFAELASTYPPGKVSDPASQVAAANGQYLLISRDTYDAVGGHTKIAGDLLEDVAMARLVKSSGRKILFRYGGDAVRTRMYRNWAQMKEGWTKNLALLFRRPYQLAGESIALFLALVLAPVLLLRDFLFWQHQAYLGDGGFQLYSVAVEAVVFTAATALFVRGIRRARFDAISVVAVLGLPMFAYLLVRSANSRRRGGVMWKGRSYLPTGDS